MNTWDDITNSKTIRGVLVAVLAVLGLFLLVLTVGAAQNLGRPASPATNVITVSGTGKATAVPNIADITFTVMETAPTVAAAQAAATDKNNAALAAVKKLGIDDKDVRTLSYNVSPHYTYSTSPCVYGACPQDGKITGYDVSETIDVKVRDTAKAGDVLQALGALGVQNISGPNFVVDNDEAVTDEARAAAIADAKARAEVLAKQLGVHLAGIVSYSEGGNYPMPIYASYGKGGAAMESAATPPSLPTGQNETEVNVSITYEIR